MIYHNFEQTEKVKYMGCSTLHIKTEIECRVFLFDEEKGIAKPGSYFNLEVRKGEQDLLFVSTNDETLRCQMFYNVEENDCDFRIVIEISQFKLFSQDFLEKKRSAEQGNHCAQYELGLCYENGLGVKQDYVEAEFWYRKAAEQGNKKAECKLGIIKYYKAAEQGDSDAQYQLGRCYSRGQYVEKNYTEAIKWYRKAAEQGKVEAQYDLASSYYNGNGVEKNIKEAIRWFHKAAMQGNANAQYQLGKCYNDGNGVQQDYAEAVNWFSKAAEQGIAAAQNNLGWCYYYGKGVLRDYFEAAKWYRKAAEQGHPAAQDSYGWCFNYGFGVKQDHYEAIKWHRKAAEQGAFWAPYSMGFSYELGLGVEKDYVEAAKWYYKAIEIGDMSANDRLKRIEAELRNRNIFITHKKSPYYLFFDTETTGVPQNYKAPASDIDNWPRLVQLGWILTDKDGNTLNEGNEIVRPEGFVIPTDAANVHGITTEKAKQLGKPLQNVIELFLNDVKQVKYLVGHNISFDQHVLGAELYRLGLQDVISNKQSICTMQSTIDFCKIPGYYGNKYPQLQELYTKLFGSIFEDAHDAMADITATKKCFFELKRIGVI